MPTPDSVGRYEILGLIAQGGMGSVYKARDPAIGRTVAIKVLRVDLDDEHRHERFLREAQAAGTLQHENIVRIFDVGEADGSPFIAMEFVEGETLSRWIRRGEAAPLSRKLELMEELCDGLAYAHSHGIVHRDIKPANLIVEGQRGRLKILDFGIAKLTATDVTQPGVLVGSLNYMSPEQIRGLPIDHRSDIFAVGAVLFEFFSYRRAFPGDLHEVLGQLASEAPSPSLLEAMPSAEPELVRIVARALEKEPARRYQDLSELRADLARARRRFEAAESADASLPFSPPTGALTPPAVEQKPHVRPDPLEPGTVAGPVSVLVPSPERSDGTQMFASPGSARAEAPPVQLVVSASRDPRLINQVVPVVPPRFEIGRDADGLRLTDPRASRRHAAIEFAAGEFLLRDFGSENGTFVNGGRLVPDRPVVLPFGSQIQIGSTILVFKYARETMLPDLTGCEVSGRYELLERLRESARGAVYAGVQRSTKARVAVKLLSPELAKYPGYRAHFQREAELAASLDHPHICSPHDFDAEAEVRSSSGLHLRLPVLCYRLMAGGSLSHLLDSDEPIPLDRITGWVNLLAGALDHAHANGVIHGDLKPTAIVFNASRTHPFLTDFSVAQCLIDGQGRPVTGAPPYMAPEQWTGAELTPAVDQFALAAITYYLITGARPFEGQEHPGVRERNFRMGPPAAHDEALRAGRAAVPDEVSRVLQRALATDPRQRFSTVTEFAAALADAASGVGRSSEPSIFISYQRGGDSRWVQTLARDLKQRYGISAYVDLAKVDVASRFPEKLEKEIRACDVFVCILTKTTLQSEWVRREIQLASKYGRPMIPVVDDTFTLEAEYQEDPAVADFLKFDWHPIYDAYMEEGVARLAGLVKNTLRNASRGRTGGR